MAGKARWPPKDPDDVLDFTASFEQFLETGETLSGKTVTASAGITKDSDAFDATNTKVIVWLSGGTIGQMYQIELDVDTSGSRTINRTVEIFVEEL